MNHTHKTTRKNTHWGRVTWRIRLLCALLIGVLAATNPSAASDEPGQTDRPGLRLYAYNDPMFTELDPVTGRAVGRTARLLEQVFTAVGQSYQIIFLPRRRILPRVREEHLSCGFSFTHTPERAPHYRWIGPIQLGGWGIFGNPDADVKAFAPMPDEAFKAMPVLALAGSPAVAELRAAGFDLLLVPTLETAIAALYGGRASYLVAGLTSVPTLAAKQGRRPPVLMRKWRDVNYYLVCSPDLPADLADRLQASVDQIPLTARH